MFLLQFYIYSIIAYFVSILCLIIVGYSDFKKIKHPDDIAAQIKKDKNKGLFMLMVKGFVPIFNTVKAIQCTLLVIVISFNPDYLKNNKEKMKMKIAEDYKD